MPTPIARGAPGEPFEMSFNVRDARSGLTQPSSP